jgi:hypothetical protein
MNTSERAAELAAGGPAELLQCTATTFGEYMRRLAAPNTDMRQYAMTTEMSAMLAAAVELGGVYGPGNPDVLAAVGNIAMMMSVISFQSTIFAFKLDLSTVSYADAVEDDPDTYFDVTLPLLRMEREQTNSSISYYNRSENDISVCVRQSFHERIVAYAREAGGFWMLFLSSASLKALAEEDPIGYLNKLAAINEIEGCGFSLGGGIEQADALREFLRDN